MKSKSRILILVVCFTMLWVMSAKATVIRVKTDGNDNYDGSSWTLAKQTITSALSVAVGGDEVWVAAGTYSYTSSGLTVPSGVMLFGGFSGTEIARDQRDWTINTTTLSFSIYNSLSCSGSGATVIDGISINQCTRINCNGNTTFAHNRVTNTGWDGLYYAISCKDSDIVVNNLFRNSSYISCTGSALFVNNTVVSADAEKSYAVVCSGSPTIANNVIAFNSNGGIRNTGTPTLSHNCVYGNENNRNYSGITPTSDINVDPLFVNRNNGDYHLTYNSPCRNAGDNTAVTSTSIADFAKLTDMDAKNRIIGQNVEIGTYERPAWHVCLNGDNTNGETWATAYTNFGNVPYMYDGDEIWIAGGEYSSTTWCIPYYLKTYGGFAGTETSRDQRNWAANPTTFAFTRNNDYLICGTGVVFDGLIFDNCMYIDFMETSVFSHNIMIGSNSSSSCSTLLCPADCIVANNLFLNTNGISCSGSSTIANNTIAESNQSRYAIKCNSGSSAISNNIVAFNNGIGIYAAQGATPVLSHNCVYSNTGGNYSGVTPISDINVDPLFVNWNNDDYHLLSNSPCIDTGDTDAITNEYIPDFIKNLDLAYSERIVNSIADIGCYEHP